METYNDFSNWIRARLPYRVQKISVDAGFTCPNRDGKVGTRGCSFCDNDTFNPSYCDRRKTVTTQLNEGKEFFARKYPDMKYLAYLQAYSNTYAPLPQLKKIYEEALSVEDVVGLVIGTRPDCVDEDTLDYMKKLSDRLPMLIVEYGIESTNDKTLHRINRGHDFAKSRWAVEQTAKRGLLCGAHVILGLPGETHDDMIRQADDISTLPINFLKIHQLQIIRGTVLGQEYLRNPFHVFSVDEYIELLGGYIQHLREDIVLARFVSQSPADMLIAPKWGLKNYEFTNLLVRYLKENGIRQGSHHAAIHD